MDTAVVHLLVALLAAALPQPHRAVRATPPPKCGEAIAFQVLLDRRGFSTGPIDARLGPNASHALSAFQQMNGLPITGLPDCPTWQALVKADAAPTTTTYRISAADAKGPFTQNIPTDLVRQARLPILGYRSILELVGERFHASPALLVRLNPRRRFAEGETITVPAVVPFDAARKPQHDNAAGEVTITVSRDDSALRAYGADGRVVFFAPVTTGSEHDPLPLGTWRVTSIDWRPVFHYNPELFWDADPSHSKAVIKEGPNNPAGVVWIGINVEHYGLHGTPSPEKVGHSESHGCVRLTNWDAARVAALVRVGTPVVFAETASAPPQSGGHSSLQPTASEPRRSSDEGSEAAGNTANAIAELRRHHLLLPIDGAHVDAMKGSFEERRGGERHEAVDILAPRNTPVHAVEGGTIAKLFHSKAGGLTVYQFDPSKRFCFYYAHLERYPDGLHDGQAVSGGDVVGYVGTSGNAPPNTPHLHFAIFELGSKKEWWKGVAIDPYLIFKR